MRRQKSFLRSRNYSVMVDNATRKPLSRKTETAAGLRSDVAKAKWTYLHKPNHTFTSKFTVCYSDLDDYNHCNVAVYTRFCIDCASLAYSQNELKYFNRDVCFYKLKSLLVRFRREALVHDEITVHGWQESTSRDAIYFQIFREAELLTQCKVTFYIDDVSKL